MFLNFTGNHVPGEQLAWLVPREKPQANDNKDQARRELEPCGQCSSEGVHLSTLRILFGKDWSRSDASRVRSGRSLCQCQEDPAYRDWSWFPHGQGKDFTFSKCLDPLEPLRDDLTVLSGLSHHRRNFLRGTAGFALALPAFETFAGIAGAAEKSANPRRLACVYLPNGLLR